MPYHIKERQLGNILISIKLSYICSLVIDARGIEKYIIARFTQAISKFPSAIKRKRGQIENLY